MKTTFRRSLSICASLVLIAHAHGMASTYTVKSGDTFAKIARHAGCSPTDLAKTNDLKLTAVIRPGQKLKLPSKSTTPVKSTTPAQVASDGVHTIQSGDTFSSISRRYGMSVDSIIAANPGIDSKSLQLGQKIRLSSASSPKEQPPITRSTQTISTSKAESKAETTASAAAASKNLVPETEAPERIEQVKTFMVEAEITYGEFAAIHGTNITRLNDLNGLDLTASTVLAKGSELYVPQ